jgi:glutamate racemase
MIGVFDSGMGGLSLLYKLRQHLPDAPFIYFADKDHVPYSYKTPEQIRTYVDDAVAFLISEGCKLIVLACNTATNVAIDYLREKYPLPIVAIQPAVKVAADNSKSQKGILVCATPVTLGSLRYQTLVHTLRISERVVNVPLPKLVEFAERGDFNSIEVIRYLYDAFKHIHLPDFEYIVLGCTHFTFYENLIEEHFKPLICVDGNEGTARRVEFMLEHNHINIPSEKNSIRFYESKRPVLDTAIYEQYLSFLNEQDIKPELRNRNLLQ